MKRKKVLFLLLVFSTLGVFAFSLLNKSDQQQNLNTEKATVAVANDSPVVALKTDTIKAVAATTQQYSDSISLFQQAFEEIKLMLEGKRQLDFKRAVFIVENAYLDNSLNYMEYCNQINSIAVKLKDLIKQKHFESYKTSGNWAAFTYMCDSIPENNFHPFDYDFDDFMGDEDWSKMFVTKLLSSKKGQCHSLPMLYKILCDEIGAEAHLALAPQHLYVKHIDEQGAWTNVELTNKSFPRDQWIISQMEITREAIKQDVYMYPMNDKESIALCLFDLAQCYDKKFGLDSFSLMVIDEGLKYYPNCINLWMEKVENIGILIENEKQRENPDRNFIEQNIALYKELNAQVDAMGYKEESPEAYAEWVKTIEQEKEKRGLTEKN